MDKTASDTRDEERVVDLELDGVLEGLLGGFKHAIKLLGLNDCSWETVENEAISSKSATGSEYDVQNTALG